jgi:hypothetical protein
MIENLPKKVKDLKMEFGYEYVISNSKKTRYARKIRKIITKSVYIEVSLGFNSLIVDQCFILEFKKKYGDWDVVVMEKTEE